MSEPRDIVAFYGARAVANREDYVTPSGECSACVHICGIKTVECNRCAMDMPLERAT